MRPSHHSSPRHTRRDLDDSLSRAMKMGGAGEPRPPARPGPRPSLLYRRLREVEQGAGAASPGQGADTWGGGGGGNTGPSSHGANLRRRRGSVGGRTPAPGPGWGGSREVEEGPPMVRGARVRYTSSSRRMLAAASSGSAAAGAGEPADMGAEVGVARAVTAAAASLLHVDHRTRQPRLSRAAALRAAARPACSLRSQLQWAAARTDKLQLRPVAGPGPPGPATRSTALQHSAKWQCCSAAVCRSVLQHCSARCSGALCAIDTAPAPPQPKYTQLTILQLIPCCSTAAHIVS